MNATPAAFNKLILNEITEDSDLQLVMVEPSKPEKNKVFMHTCRLFINSSDREISQDMDAYKADCINDQHKMKLYLYNLQGLLYPIYSFLYSSSMVVYIFT